MDYSKPIKTSHDRYETEAERDRFSVDFWKLYLGLSLMLLALLLLMVSSMNSSATMLPDEGRAWVALEIDSIAGFGFFLLWLFCSIGGPVVVL